MFVPQEKHAGLSPTDGKLTLATGYSDSHFQVDTGNLTIATVTDDNSLSVANQAMHVTQIDQLINLMTQLRDPEHGCAWDIEQTFSSIAPYTIEEAYEVVDAIASGDHTALKDELGDLLLQVVFHAQIADEKQLFSFPDVAQAISDKLIRRHPHVFGDTRYRNKQEQASAWEAIKRAERGVPEHASVLDGVNTGMAAFTRAHKLQSRAASVGFDWDTMAPVVDKIREELGEIEEVINEPEQNAADQQERLTDEIGDLLFASCNLARHSNVDPEIALRSSCQKFEQRFRWIETALRAQNREAQDVGLEELEELWQAAKSALRTGS